MISSCPDYLHADVSDEGDLSLHQQEVTGGQLITMSLVPGTVDSDVTSECHLCCPSLLPSARQAEVTLRCHIRVYWLPASDAARHSQAARSPQSISQALPLAARPREGVLRGQQRRTLCLATELEKRKKTWDFFFGCGYAATQLALQLLQERAQVVRSNKAARKRLARRHSRNGPLTIECCFEVDVFVC